MIAIFLFLITLILVAVSFKDSRDTLYIGPSKIYVMILGTLFLTAYLFLLSKQNLLQSDMIYYFNNMKQIHYLISFNNISEVLNQTEFEKGFVITQLIIGYLTNNSQVYGILMYSLILLLILISAWNYFGIERVPFVMIHYVFFTVFNTISLIVIRQGMAIGILILSLTVYLKGHKKMALIWMLLAAQFHSTAYIMVFVFIIIYIFKIDLKKNIYTWIFLSFAYITNWNKDILKFIPVESKYLDSYTGDLWSSQSAMYGQEPNSIKYLVISGAFLIIILLLKRFFLNSDRGMSFLVNIYVIWNSVFLLFGFVAFSSRIALYSWLLFPFILFYAFTSNRLLRTYYPVFLIIWIIIGAFGLPIMGWQAL